MPQSERVRVLKGELKKTSGGLTAKDLVRNKRGKVVSRKKSDQAGQNDNNLGSWLRGKGDKFQGKPKGFKAEVDDRDDEKVGELPAPKPKPKKKKPPPPKKAPPPKKKKKQVVVDLTDSPVKAKPKAAKKKKVEPMKPGEKKDLSKVSVGNIHVPGKKTYEDQWKVMKRMGFTDEEVKEILSGGGLKNAAKVRRALKASKRRGKRRTKKKLLQDVLDL